MPRPLTEIATGLIRGVVVARFTVIPGGPLSYVVRHKAGNGRHFCLIYSGADLRRVDDEQERPKEG